MGRYCTKIGSSRIPDRSVVVDKANTALLQRKMSSDVGDASETRESASSPVPEASDSPRNGSGDHPTGDGSNDVGQVARPPLQNTSTTSNATEAESKVKEKRKALELQDSITLGNGVSEPNDPGKKARKRLSLEQKVEVLQLLKDGTKHAEIARRYACSERAVSSVAEKKGELELKMKSPGFNGKAKTERPAGFPELDERVGKMVEDARRLRVPVTRQIISSFGRAVKTQMMSSDETSDAQKARLSSFFAGEKWTRNFVRRQGLESKALHGKAGGVGGEAAKEGMEAIREVARHYSMDNIFDVHETGLFFKVLPRGMYVLSSEGRKTARAMTDMEAKDRVLVYLCANASGSLKVPISIIGKSVKPRCFQKRSPPVKYFSQKESSSDWRTLQRWWMEVFLPYIEEKTSGEVLLIMDGFKSRVLDDPSGRVRVMHLPPNCTSVRRPMGMGVVAAIKLNYRRRLLDCRADKLCEAAALQQEGSLKKVRAGTGGLEHGRNPHMHDVGILLKDAWDGIKQVTIARCWALAETLPPDNQQAIQDLRQEKGDTCASNEKTDSGGCSGEVERELKNTINKASLCLQVASEETRAAFKDLGDMISCLGIELGAGASKEALKTAVEWLNLEAQRDVSEALENDRQEDILRNIESNMGYRSDDDLDNDGEELGTKQEAPQDISVPSDAPDEHPKVAGSS